MYEAELKELGLTDNEVKIYLAILQSGVINPTKLAEKTGLHRSYLYDTLERLLEQGIINTILIKNKKHYQAVDPKVLREQFEIKLKHIDSILPKLSSIFSATKEETHVELHKGKRVYKTLIKDLTANLQNNDLVYLIGIDEEILEGVEPIYLKQYFAIIKEKKVKEKIIIAKGGKRFEEKDLEYKELNKKYLGETAIVIHNNKVYLFILGEPNYLIVIESKKVAKTYKKNFELFWESSK
jgi:sugar-specific transcriptional regulator TrmB